MKRALPILILIASLILLTKDSQSQTAEPNFVLDWIASSFVPADYPGKALPTQNSAIKVTAMSTQKTNFNLADLKYNWYLNGRWERSASGAGKAEFAFIAAKPASSFYEVKVRIIRENALISQKTIFIKIVAPEILIYKLENGITSYNELGPNSSLPANQSVNLISKPYFFNINSLADLNFSWQFGEKKLDGENQQNPERFILKIGEIRDRIEEALTLAAQNKFNTSEKALQRTNVLIYPLGRD